LIITCPECEDQTVVNDNRTNEQLAKILPRCKNCKNLFDWSED